MTRPRNSAFTLVELLVVIAIIGILVSMMLPAVQATRESARRTECTSRVSQLILAVHEYEASHEHYPVGTSNAKGPIRNLPDGQHINWIARILPYLDEPALYDVLNLNSSAYSKQNDRGRHVTVPILICPSCAASLWPYSNYAACHSDVETPIDVTNTGVFFLNSQTTRDDLTDGAAYTLFLGEKLPDAYDLGWLSGTSATLRNVGTPLNQKAAGSVVDSPPVWFHADLAGKQSVQPSGIAQSGETIQSSTEQGGNCAGRRRQWKHNRIKAARGKRIATSRTRRRTRQSTRREHRPTFLRRRLRQWSCKRS